MCSFIEIVLYKRELLLGSAKHTIIAFCALCELYCLLLSSGLSRLLDHEGVVGCALHCATSMCYMYQSTRLGPAAVVLYQPRRGVLKTPPALQQAAGSQSVTSGENLTSEYPACQNTVMTS